MALYFYRTLSMRQSSFSLPMMIARARLSQSTTSQSNQTPKSDGASSKNTSITRFGPIVILTVAIYAAFKMVSDRSSELRQNEHYKRATADYQKINAQGTDVKT